MNAGSQILTGILMGLCVCILTACGRVEKERSETAVQEAEATLQQTAIPENYYTENSKVTEVMRDPAFGDYRHLIFPVDIAISEDLELKDVEDILPWYSEVNPKKTVEIVNYMKDRVTDGEQIFYDIYSEEEKEANPAKEDTGLFFFRGDPGAKTAIVNAGGGFMYVAAMHDSFPQALELAKNGYNAFALIYRPGADTACEDLARAIAYLHEHAQELQIDMTDYSLWGGSAGARMAAWLGSYGTAYFGEEEYPAPAAVIMQYTGLSSVTGQEPPTYACVGTFPMDLDWGKGRLRTVGLTVPWTSGSRIAVSNTEK